MNVLIVDIISVLTVIGSATIVILVSRKLTNAITLGRELAKELKYSGFNLEKIRESLLEQYQNIHEEGLKLEARLKEANKVKKNINNLIAHMEASHTILKESYTEVENLKGEISNDVELLKKEIEKLPKYSKYSIKEASSSQLSENFKLKKQTKTPYVSSRLPVGNSTSSLNLKPFSKKDSSFLFETKLNKPPEK